VQPKINVVRYRISDEVTDVVIAGEIVTASADEDVLYGTAENKLEAMKNPYITNRSVDGED